MLLRFYHRQNSHAHALQDIESCKNPITVQDTFADTTKAPRAFVMDPMTKCVDETTAVIYLAAPKASTSKASTPTGDT